MTSLTFEMDLKQTQRNYPDSLYDIALAPGYLYDPHKGRIVRCHGHSPNSIRGKISGKFESSRFGVLVEDKLGQIMVEYEAVSRIYRLEDGLCI